MDHKIKIKLKLKLNCSTLSASDPAAYLVAPTHRAAPLNLFYIHIPFKRRCHQYIIRYSTIKS